MHLLVINPSTPAAGDQLKDLLLKRKVSSVCKPSAGNIAVETTQQEGFICCDSTSASLEVRVRYIGVGLRLGLRLGIGRVKAFDWGIL